MWVSCQKRLCETAWMFYHESCSSLEHIVVSSLLVRQPIKKKKPSVKAPNWEPCNKKAENIDTKTTFTLAG